jgi:hypothetical protein
VWRHPRGFDISQEKDWSRIQKISISGPKL